MTRFYTKTTLSALLFSAAMTGAVGADPPMLLKEAVEALNLKTPTRRPQGERRPVADPVQQGQAVN